MYYAIEWFDLIGISGVLVYIASYACLQLRLIDSKGSVYSLANLTAAALILVSLSYNFNLASAMIQVSWIIISIVGLLIRCHTHMLYKSEKAGSLRPSQVMRNKKA